jgi:glutamate-1-semialdehyde 2,1-aminomutase
VPEGTVADTLTAPFNDLGAVEKVVEAHGSDLAAIIVEPVAGNMGVVAPREGYLQGLRDLATRAGAILIFDEVMTGFRLSTGGAQVLYGVKPDLTCLGKIIGGGLPCGAFGGRAEIMNMLAPLGPVYQAGTLSGNPLAMAAGVATLAYLAANHEAVYSNIDKGSRAVAEGVASLLANAGMPVTTNRVGAMWTWFFTQRSVVDFATAATSDTARFGAFHRAMMDQGVWLPPSQFEAIFLGTAHTPEIIEATLSAARQAVSSLHEAHPAR